MQDPSLLKFTVMKNEGPFILEWLAWQRLMGVDRVLVLTNDCDDGTDRLLDALDREGIVRHLPNPVSVMPDGLALQPHTAGIAYAKLLPEWRGADYIFLSDIDEFPVIRKGGGTLKDLLRRLDFPDVISMSETVFGTGDIHDFEDQAVTAQFLKSASTRPGKWRARRGFKSITRNDPKLVIRNHRPIARQAVAQNLNWLDGSGQTFPQDLRHVHQKGCDARGMFDLVMLHHYALRSLESFLVKVARGDAVVEGRVDATYFRRRNQLAEANTDMLAHQPALLDEISRLKSLPDIAELHETSVAAHRAKITALKDTPLYDQLLTLTKGSDAALGDA